MTSELPPNSPTTRSFSLSIGQLTFGSFLLVLAVIIITSTASVIAIRHIDSTFAELQRLQSVGDLAEDIDRRMNELRLAARDFVTDPGTQSVQVGEAATSLSEILKKTRLELAPEQQDMIDGVTERLSTYRSGIERISALINRRAEMIVALPPLREKFDAAVKEIKQCNEKGHALREPGVGLHARISELEVRGGHVGQPSLLQLQPPARRDLDHTSCHAHEGGLNGFDGRRRVEQADDVLLV